MTATSKVTAIKNLSLGDEKVNFTPGPWHWWDKNDGRPEPYDLAKLLNKHGEVVLTLYGGPGSLALGRTTRDISNGLVIAHAPELMAENVKLRNQKEKLLKAALLALEVIGKEKWRVSYQALIEATTEAMK